MPQPGGGIGSMVFVGSVELSNRDGVVIVPAMRAVLVALGSVLRSRASLHLDVLALRHQLAALQSVRQRPRMKPADLILWVWLSRAWSGWQNAFANGQRLGFLHQVFELESLALHPVAFQELSRMAGLVGAPDSGWIRPADE